MFKTNISKGFTLIELLVVIAIIAMLATVGITSYRTLTSRARDGRRASDVENVRAALEAYRTENGNYPATADIWTELAGPPILLATQPMDPRTGTSFINYVRLTTTTYTIDYLLDNGASAPQLTNPL